MNSWYYYNSQNAKIGPIEEYSIKYLIRIREINENTLVLNTRWKKPKMAIKVFPNEFQNSQSPTSKRDSSDTGFSSSNRRVAGTDSNFVCNLSIFNYLPPPNNWFILIIIFGAVSTILILCAFIAESNRVVLAIIIFFVFIGGGSVVFAVLQERLSFCNSILEDARAILEQNRTSAERYNQQLNAYSGRLRNIQQNINDTYNTTQRMQAGQEDVVIRTSAIARHMLQTAVEYNSVKLNQSNYPECKERLVTAINSCEAVGIIISKAEKNNYLKQLQKDYEKLIVALQERERQKEIKAKIREEQRREKEQKQLEKEAQQAAKDQKDLEDAINKALQEANGIHTAQIKELEEKLKEAEERSIRAESMAQQTKAGFVYIISNIGAFGKNIYKIGMSRRLEPLDRVKELSGASVPFPFDVHAMISSEDAPSLEHSLHQAFHRKRINKINLRKEFFAVTLDEVIKEAEKSCGHVEFKADAEALEYYQSLNISDEDADFIENVYSKNAYDSEED